LLATIVSIDPIYFEFTFDEASYLRYERLARTGQDIASRNASVQIALKLIDENDFDHKGRMDFVDNVIDRSTGTIRGRAVFANPNEVFTPGMFARVRVPGSPPYEALLVPDAAIGTEQARRFVMIIDAQDIARPKYVTLGQLTSDNLRVIKDGIGPDDRVVVSGLMQARPGQKVWPEEQGAKPAGPASAGGPPQQAK
jgi:RND family efflux transporter MFP subunit